jgi:hypothetical protein
MGFSPHDEITSTPPREPLNHRLEFIDPVNLLKKNTRE